MTLEQLAEQTNLSKSAPGKYETAEFKDISPYAIIQLAKFYGVTADYLLGLTETKNHPNANLLDLHLSDVLLKWKHRGYEISTIKEGGFSKSVERYFATKETDRGNQINFVFSTFESNEDARNTFLVFIQV